MRITNKMMTNNALYNINNNKNLLSNLEQQYSSGKKITKPSDDPIVAVRALKFRTNLAELNQYYEKNIIKEENKGGLFPEDVADFCKKAKEYPHIRVRGLMTMAPKCQSREEYLKYFGLTKELFDKLFGDDENAILSMGMSDSYTYAIEAGANLVRVGSKIFGERKY